MAREDDGAAGDGFYFEGVESPNGTIFPDILLDRVMPHLSGAEFKVLAYIVRRTFGFKKESDAISLDQICNGIARRDGSILDEGTGLARKTAVAAIQGLEAKGVILCQRRSSPEKGNLPTTFALRFKGQGAPTPGANRNQGGSERYPGGGDGRHQPGHPASPALGTPLHSQSTVVQPTVQQGGIPTGVTPADAAALAACWEATLDRLAARVGEVSYRAWLAPARLAALDAAGATVAVANPLARRWLERNLADMIAAELAIVVGQPLPVRVVTAAATVTSAAPAGRRRVTVPADAPPPAPRQHRYE